MKLQHLLILSLLLIVGLVSADLFLKDPPVWPDEAIYADVAINILKENRLGTDLWKGVIPGVDNHAYWYPPLFFYSIAFWLKIVGFSIINQRLLSTLVAMCFVIIFYLFTKLFFKADSKKETSPMFPVLSLGMLFLDITFLRSTRVSRPEIFVLFWGILSLYFFLRSTEQSLSGKTKSILIGLSGFTASLAFLNHTIALFFFTAEIVFLLITEKVNLIRSKNFYLFILVFLIPILFWIISIFPNLDILKEQFILAAARKSLDETWIWKVFLDQPWILKFVYTFYISITLVFILYARKSKTKEDKFLSLLLLVSWAFVIYGKQFWYYVFPVPFIYLALSKMLSSFYNMNIWEKESKKKYSFFILLILFVSIITTNVYIHITSLEAQAGDKYSYFRLTDKVLEVIPDGKSVFLSSIPDVYYGLKITRPDTKLYEFPVLDTQINNYLKILDESDYIVYNGSYEMVLFKDFLAKYIEKNQYKVNRIGEHFQYQTLVIELKPRSERVAP